MRGRPRAGTKSILMKEKGKPKTYFTPYRSPLAQFKEFKYHPNYLNDVPGGFKSWTYNHQIDADIPLCHYEILDGKCNDSNCDAQHFATMGLSGASRGTSSQSRLTLSSLLLP